MLASTQGKEDLTGEIKGKVGTKKRIKGVMPCAR